MNRSSRLFSASLLQYYRHRLKLYCSRSVSSSFALFYYCILHLSFCWAYERKTGLQFAITLTACRRTHMAMEYIFICIIYQIKKTTFIEVNSETKHIWECRMSVSECVYVECRPNRFCNQNEAKRISISFWQKLCAYANTYEYEICRCEWKQTELNGVEWCKMRQN